MKRNHLATLRQTFVALPLKQELEEKECFWTTRRLTDFFFLLMYVDDVFYLHMFKNR
jgi:hypothetical protein